MHTSNTLYNAHVRIHDNDRSYYPQFAARYHSIRNEEAQPMCCNTKPSELRTAPAYPRPYLACVVSERVSYLPSDDGADAAACFQLH